MAENIVRLGLEGVPVAETRLSLVDGENGHLVYRGYWARELAVQSTFEDVAHLLWKGRLPNENEREDWIAEMAAHRELPSHVTETIDRIPAHVGMMNVLRTAVSLLGEEDSWPPTLEQAVSLTAKVPTIIAYRQARLSGKEPLQPRRDLTHTANYLYMLNGEEPRAAHVQALDAYLVLTQEHGMNASTFATRVVGSTQSDLVSAVVAGIGALKGPLHGGAPSEVLHMLEEIGQKDRAESWLRNKLESGERIMGFGHRVYKKTDPRAEALRTVASRLAGDDEWFDLAVHVEKTALELLAQYKPGRRLATNVEFYAAAVMRAIQLPPDLFTPTFTVSRVVGWTAHLLEQAENNRIIRPQSVYVGPMPHS